MRQTIISLLFLLSSSLVFANGKSFIVDFEDQTSYVNALNSIRTELGEALPNITPIANTAVYGLPPAGGPREGHTITLSNVDAGEESPVSLVIDPSNLYVAGFTVENTYYRFSDTRDVTLPSLYRVVDLQTGSDYTNLQSIGNIQRSELTVNRSNLSQSIIDLQSIHNDSNPSQLNRAQARAILRLITIIPEAIRFREIQRGFRASFFSYQDFMLTRYMIDLTLNWGTISQFAFGFGALNQADTFTRGAINIAGNRGLIAVLGLALHCVTNAPGASASKIPSGCPVNKNVTFSDGRNLTKRDLKRLNLIVAEKAVKRADEGDGFYNRRNYSSWKQWYNTSKWTTPLGYGIYGYGEGEAHGNSIYNPYGYIFADGSYSVGVLGTDAKGTDNWITIAGGRSWTSVPYAGQMFFDRNGRPTALVMTNQATGAFGAGWSYVYKDGMWEYESTDDWHDRRFPKNADSLDSNAPKFKITNI